MEKISISIKKLIKKILLIGLFFLFGCSSEEPFYKDKIVYADKELFNHIKKEYLLSKVETIRQSKCENLAKKKFKKRYKMSLDKTIVGSDNKLRALEEGSQAISEKTILPAESNNLENISPKLDGVLQ